MRSGDYRLLGTVVSPHTEMQLKDNESLHDYIIISVKNAKQQ